MLILALESSAKPASAAICSESGELIGQYFQNSGLTHSRTLLSMAESLLTDLSLSAADIGLVAVSSGPGSFTGVRIGVAAAKGLAWGLNKPVCGVSTLEAMVWQYDEPGVILCPVMDARRGQVYNAVFTRQGGILERHCPDRAISLEDLSAELTGADDNIILLGDGAAIGYDYLTSAGVPCRMAPVLTRFQTAYGVALAAIGKQSIAADELEPFYLRPSQAERERAARETR